MADDTPLYFVRGIEGGRDTRAAREAATAEHIAWLRSHAQRLRFAGPYFRRDRTTKAGTMAVIESPDRAGAQAFIDGEAFNRAGVFDTVEVVRFASLLGLRQRDLHPDPRLLGFLVRWELPPSDDHADLPDPPPADPASLRLFELGLLLTDDGTTVIGGLALAEAVDDATIEAYAATIAHERRTTLHIDPWRFGHSIGSAATSAA